MSALGHLRRPAAGGSTGAAALTAAPGRQGGSAPQALDVVRIEHTRELPGAR